ncbi:MAG TPA: U32 family peptidase [Myxococcota bacterium]|nr:U32 family peptidase [Myxococcota bacterium]HRY93233.1 U32 family peptidase [Myxococcota bacterium]HSA21038.1 U32 family peptidase [Myxococcota bacterium]
MRLSVACNFDEALLDGLQAYPVYEIYGKLTSDYFGGGRPSFYLPEVDRPGLERFVAATHRRGIQFNYLLNASAMGNTEFSREGQRHIEELLGWLDGIGVDSVTVANVFFLRLVKRRHPRLKVRISSHRFTDTPRKVRFWVENGADYIVVSEVNIHREFKVLAGMQQAAQGVELQLIVNNWCRQDCAIAGNHAVGLSAASQTGNRGFPLDYCSVICNRLRLEDPVNYLRANWIRPEDLHLYEQLGYHNFKIVERNTPTQILLERVHAYANRRHDGNLLDLVQNYAYPLEKMGPRGKDAYSTRRMLKYFVKPQMVNMVKFMKVIEFGKAMSVLYPRVGPNPVQIDNRALDGFLERFKTQGCQDVDCESCRYCHEWAARTVRIDPEWKARVQAILAELMDELDSGALWDPYLVTARQLAGAWFERVSGGAN